MSSEKVAGTKRTAAPRKKSDSLATANATKAQAKATPAKKTSPTAAGKKTEISKNTAGKAKTTLKDGTSTKAKVNGTAPAPQQSRKRKTEDEEQREGSPVKKTRVTKQPKAPVAKAKIIINTLPATRLDVFVCGEGSAGELGLGTAKNAMDVKRPRLNPNLLTKDVGVVQVVCGGMHAVALTHDGTVLTWGVNDDGALGRDTTWEGGLKDMDDNKSDTSDDSDDSDNGMNPREANPGPVTFPEGTKIVKVAAGDSATLALTDDGLVFGWGKFRVSNLLSGIWPNQS